MARYRLLTPNGVRDTQAPAHDVMPSMYVEWQAYLAWLALGNVPDPALPPPDRYPTLAAKRAEMLARLDAYADQVRFKGQVIAVGNTWKITRAFWLAVLTARNTQPPAGASLLNSSRVLVALSVADLHTLCNAISDRLNLIRANIVTKVAAINAAADPFTVDITTGWPA